MKFVSFNINGLRARPHQLAAIVEKHQPDVIGLQETKVHDDMFPLEEVAVLGYNVFYHGQKGHYGVALLTKETPIAVRRGFPDDGEEAQRRIIMAEIPSPFGNVTVINGYFLRVKAAIMKPNSRPKRRSIRICRTIWRPSSTKRIRC